MLDFVLFLVSVILLGLAALGVSASRVSLFALGVMFAVLPFLIHAGQALA